MDHRPKHKRACKERVAELRDEILFRQPVSSHLGDCPICCLPLPLDIKQSIMHTCCSKLICEGCVLANFFKLNSACPFCRSSVKKMDTNKTRMKRAEVNDPVALREIGVINYREGDYETANEYWTKAQLNWAM